MLSQFALQREANARPCITEAELEQAVGDQLRAGAFAIDASMLGERQMCSGVTVATAIQRLNERYFPRRPTPPRNDTPDARQSSKGSGQISGEISYPSDYIPADITICAENINARGETCSRRVTRNGNDVTYSMTLPSGRYRIYARSADMPGRKAYYSQAVICGGGHGGDARCTNHRPVVIEVSAGSSRSRVNPQDWYAD